MSGPVVEHERHYLCPAFFSRSAQSNMKIVLALGQHGRSGTCYVAGQAPPCTAPVSCCVYFCPCPFDFGRQHQSSKVFRFVVTPFSARFRASTSLPDSQESGVTTHSLCHSPPATTGRCLPCASVCRARSAGALFAFCHLPGTGGHVLGIVMTVDIAVCRLYCNGKKLVTNTYYQHYAGGRVAFLRQPRRPCLLRT